MSNNLIKKYFFLLKLRYDFVNNNLNNKFIINNDYLTLFGIFYLLASLLPILPTGSIFSSSNGSFFWIIFSLTNYRSFNLDSFFNKTK